MIVVIATEGGRPELLRRTLDYVDRAEKPEGYSKTIVIENGGQRDVEAVVDGFSEAISAEYFFLSEGNKSKALNTVLDMVKDELLVFLDDDVRLSSGLLGKYAQAVAGRESGYFFGGPLEIDYPDGEPLPWVRPYLPASARGWQWEQSEQVNRPVFLGANWAAFADDLRKAGGFDAERGPGAISGSVGQETAMQARLLQNGVMGQYIPGAVVWHYVPAERCSPEWILQRAYRHGVGAGLDYISQGISFNERINILLRIYMRGWLREIAAFMMPFPSWRFKARWWRNYKRGLFEALDRSQSG